jgi:hypothetical protein
MTTYQVRYYTPGESSPNRDASAQLYIFEFGSSPEAQAVIQKLRASFNSCTSGSHYAAGTDNRLADSIAITATSPSGFASVHTFRSPDGSQTGSPIGIASDTHEYFAQHGTLIEALRLNGNAYIDSHDSDGQTLSTIATHLVDS